MDTYRTETVLLNYFFFKRLSRCRSHRRVYSRLWVTDYLEGDVGLGPVLQVREQQVGVPVNEIDTDQLLTAWSSKLWRTLTYGPSTSLHTRSLVLTVGQLTQRQRRGRNLTQLTARHDQRNEGIIFGSSQT